MTEAPTAGELLDQMAARIDAQDWDGLAALLAPDFTARYAHTGEDFDRGGFVALNRDYPGAWSFEREVVVDAGEHATLRARVSDATGESPETHVVASFGTARQGLLAELVEVWAEVVDPAGLRR